jgi:pyruvate dehydrogenase E2 component (dihydrolipoamide acetyltransferase)
MPSLGADMEAGTLVEWVRHPGDTVRRGDIVAVVDTQKGAIEIEVFEDGVLERIAVQPGEKVLVGTLLATIRTDAAQTAAPPPAAPAARPPDADVHAGEASAPEPGPRPPSRPPGSVHPRSSPAARRRAAELGVDLATVTGTGPDGAITSGDVEAAATTGGAQASAPRADPGDRVAGMRSAIAAAMAKAKREIPHYYLSTAIDMGVAMEWLRHENETRPMPERLLPISLLVRAVARALREVPDLNGYWVDGAFRPGPGIHIGLAISLRGGGLIAPAIHDVDRKDIGAVMADIRDLVRRARGGSLKSSELTDATTTVTNLGEQGVDAAFGIIYPPQVALVGFGRIADRPGVRSGVVAVRTQMTATLSADHRASDGHRGGRLLAAIDRLLQAPEQL